MRLKIICSPCLLLYSGKEMKQQKYFALKTILAFSLYLFASQTWGIAIHEKTPTELSSKEWHSIFKLISYPKQKLNNRYWAAEENDAGAKMAYVESNYYKIRKNYRRYYKVNCLLFKNDNWTCSEPLDVIQINVRKNTYEIFFVNKVPSAEAVSVINFMDQSGFLITDKTNQIFLKKEIDSYQVLKSFMDGLCTIRYEITSTNNGRFLSLKEVGRAVCD
jgi:hypothetical protein